MATIDFKGRVAVVTGAGGGLGREYALELGRRGCSVVVNDPGVARDGTGGDPRVADRVVAEIEAAGGQAAPCYDGVETAAGGESILDLAERRFGQVDILIHNAGILRDRSFAKMTEPEWRAVIDVHLNGAFNVASAAWRRMKPRAYGRVLFTTSVSGLFGNFGQASYGAAKMGMVGVMNTLAIEGAKYGIHTNCISPIADTRMTGDLDRTGLPPVSRDPKHVVPAAIYLVSQACPANGMIIHAGNGFFGRIQLAHNEGVFLGREPVDAEAVARSWREITDMGRAHVTGPGRAFIEHVYGMASGG